MVELSCTVGADRRPLNCRVLTETPLGQGFGAKALEIARQRSIGPQEAPIGGRVNIPIRFSIPGPIDDGYAAAARGDYAAAFRLWLASAEQGQADAEELVGLLYEHGNGVPVDYTQSVAWFRKAAAQGNALAENELGRAAITGHGGPIDFVAAREWYRQAAEQGLVDAEANLGAMMMDGKGGATDYEAARGWLTKAAQQGSAEAEYNLGILEYRVKSYAKAREWYVLSAENGLDLGQYNLANMYKNGEGGPADLVKAREWFIKAANQGLNQAEFQLAVFYTLGEGGVIDYQQARMWFQKAGHPEDVAYVDAKIAGARGDLKLERSILLRISDTGSAIVQFDLGMMYASGQGGPIDYIKAKKWLQSAAKQGYPEAVNALSKIGAHGR